MTKSDKALIALVGGIAALMFITKKVPFVEGMAKFPYDDPTIYRSKQRLITDLPWTDEIIWERSSTDGKGSTLFYESRPVSRNGISNCPSCGINRRGG